MSTAVNALASLLVGFWIEYRGFTHLYWTAFFVQLLTIMVTYHYMRPQSFIPALEKISSNYCNVNTTMNNICNELISMCTVFSARRTNRSRKRTISLLITTIAFIFHCLATLSLGVPFLWFQLNYPFCWSGEFECFLRKIILNTCLVFPIQLKRSGTTTQYHLSFGVLEVSLE